jgi:hypothetical protein
MPENYPYVDLNGILNIQKDYLGNLSASDTVPPAIITQIQSNLSNMYTDYAKANVSTDSAITRQKEVLDIVNAEKKRLEDKKQGVDNAAFGQKRAVELNNSNRLKQNSYTNLIIILIITLALFVGIMIASNVLTSVPQVVFDLLSIIVISVGIYIALYSFLNIQSRNNMDFNKLDLPGLKNSTAGNTLASGEGSTTNLITGSTGCVGSDCCGPQTEWDQQNNVCKTTITQPFTTMSFSYNTGDIAKVAANSPYEFDDYVPIK